LWIRAIYLAPGARETCLLPIRDSSSARPQIASLCCNGGFAVFPVSNEKFGPRVRKASVKNALGGDLRRLGAVVRLKAAGGWGFTGNGCVRGFLGISLPR
jgi:hypothetical protein